MNLAYTILSSEAEKWIIAFYGYGQNANTFNYLSQKIKSDYNILVIDLPYQQLESPIDKLAFVEFIVELRNKYRMNHVIGLSYSIGSRLALILAECMPEFISKVILIAPDGIEINSWNQLSTRTIIGQSIFRLILSHHGFYLQILDLLHNMRWLSKSKYALTKWHMRNKTSSRKVYHTWMNMRNLIPNLQLIKNNQSEFHFDIIAYFGKLDKIIPKKCIQKLANEIPLAKIIELNKGHKLLDKDLFDDIAQHL